MSNYPQSPGYKEQTTSRDAATSVKTHARTIRERLQALFRAGWVGTTDQAASALCEPFISVRPRFSELHRDGVIEHYKRVKGHYGKDVWAWRHVRTQIEMENL